MRSRVATAWIASTEAAAKALTQAYPVRHTVSSGSRSPFRMLYAGLAVHQIVTIEG
jgi:hypothetical protein